MAYGVAPPEVQVSNVMPPLVKTWRYRGKHAARARSFNEWLVRDWLKEGEWQDRNVFVFDFYTILTGADHHHRIQDGEVEHIYRPGCDAAFYPVRSGDSHPSSEGNRRATDEFVPLLNAWYGMWKANAVLRDGAPTE